MENKGPYVSRHGLDQQGFITRRKVYWNLPAAAALRARPARGERPILARHGPLVTTTGQHTGRSPNDKFVVREPTTEGDIWWGKVNSRIEPDELRRILERAPRLPRRTATSSSSTATPAPTPTTGCTVRVINENAWHNLFARNMFIREADGEELATSQPEFTVIHAPSFQADPGARRHPQRRLHPARLRPAPGARSAAPSTPARSRSRSSR